MGDAISPEQSRRTSKIDIARDLANKSAIHYCDYRREGTSKMRCHDFAVFCFRQRQIPKQQDRAHVHTSFSRIVCGSLLSSHTIFLLIWCGPGSGTTRRYTINV